MSSSFNKTCLNKYVTLLVGKYWHGTSWKPNNYDHYRTQCLGFGNPVSVDGGLGTQDQKEGLERQVTQDPQPSEYPRFSWSE